MEPEDLRQGMKMRTKAHYNSKTGLAISHRESKELRTKTEAFPLRKFHNEIKHALLMHFAYGKERLIDLGCGRGGDIWKWIDVRVKNVTGLDLSDGEIEEAKVRFEEARQRRHSGPLPNAEFIQTDKLDMELIPIKPQQRADVVTCMFVIHYFFISEPGCKQLFANIANFLKPDGYFICCFPDAKRVIALLDGRDRADMPSLSIARCWQGQPKCFTSGYTFSLKDTVTEIVHDNADESNNSNNSNSNKSNSTNANLRNSREFQKEPQQASKAPPPEEYLVFFNVFEALAAEVGLYPVVDYPPTLAALFEEEDKERPFKHFKPNREAELRDNKSSFRGSDPSLGLASGINVALVMQKRAKSERRDERPRETRPAEQREWDRIREREREKERERGGEVVKQVSQRDEKERGSFASPSSGSTSAVPPRRPNPQLHSNTPQNSNATNNSNNGHSDKKWSR
jgi:mRNA (guanine-N7-)-methyltransferase